MRLRPLFTLSLGVVLAGSAVAYIHAFMKSSPPEREMRNVVTLSDDIPFGGAIEADNLVLRPWPANAIPDGAFLSINDVLGDDEAKLRRAKYLLASGDLLIDHKVSNFGEQITITEKINPSMRAVTVRVDDITGVAGFIAAADRIDLTLTRIVDQNLVTSTILQDVEVLGIDQPGAPPNGRAAIRAVTVQVKPVDAQKLALAQQAGTLSLSLRHIDAADRPVLDSIDVSDLVDQVEEIPKKPRLGLPSVVVNRRGERSTVEVPSG